MDKIECWEFRITNVFTRLDGDKYYFRKKDIVNKIFNGKYYRGVVNYNDIGLYSYINGDWYELLSSEEIPFIYEKTKLIVDYEEYLLRRYTGELSKYKKEKNFNMYIPINFELKDKKNERISSFEQIFRRIKSIKKRTR